MPPPELAPDLLPLALPPVPEAALVASRVVPRANEEESMPGKLAGAPAAVVVVITQCVPSLSHARKAASVANRNTGEQKVSRAPPVVVLGSKVKRSE